MRLLSEYSNVKRIRAGSGRKSFGTPDESCKAGGSSRLWASVPHHLKLTVFLKASSASMDGRVERPACMKPSTQPTPG